MIGQQELVQQLVTIYQHHENWHKVKLSVDEAYEYFKVLIGKNCLVYHCVEDRVVGYVEFWRVDFPQLVRIASNQPFHIDEEDIETGNICYVHNVWIDPYFRKSFVTKALKDKFFAQCHDCEYFAGFKAFQGGKFMLHQGGHYGKG